MRNDVGKAGNSQQARKAVEGCAKDFPGEKSAQIASHFLVNTFPTAEQQQINQIKAQNERLEAAQREEQDARRSREIYQEYKDRMEKTDRYYAERMRESEERRREIDAASRANRPISCSISGSTVNCY